MTGYIRTSVEEELVKVDVGKLRLGADEDIAPKESELHIGRVLVIVG